MDIHEIFASIQGEGKYTGFPTTFVRLYGCNLNCKYCDQPQNKEDRQRMSVTEVIRKVRSNRLEHVCITGGEPMSQGNTLVLVLSLVAEGYTVSIETNGSREIPKDNYLRSFSYCMDIKCPSSGESHRNKFSNLERLHKQDEVKFVIADRKDYEFALKVINKYPTSATKLFSPMFSEKGKQNIGEKLSKWLVEDKVHNARVQIQLHKVLGVQ